MGCIGFSTGALALGDWQKALDMLKGSSATAVELSALRERELAPLVKSLPELDLSGFKYVYFHAPSNLEELSEGDVVAMLEPIAANGWPIVVHPGTIQDYALWSTFGALLCIENMDRRKPTGRTLEELSLLFENLPSASFCFDLGHARHVDRTMSQANAILRVFNARIKIVHLSEVDIHGRHVPLSFMAMLSFCQLYHIIPEECPIILESPLQEPFLDTEIDRVEHILSSSSEMLSLTR